MVKGCVKITMSDMKKSREKDKSDLEAVGNKMDKYEFYAVSHYLTDWPEEWSFSQVFDELLNGDEGNVISQHYHYDGIPPEDMAYCIKDMVSSLRRLLP